MAAGASRLGEIGQGQKDLPVTQRLEIQAAEAPQRQLGSLRACESEEEQDSVG